MANAEKLLHEAEFAFRNISPGSADEKKYAARARRYASKLLRKYPASPEAEQANNILRRLGFGYAIAKPKSKQRPKPRPRPSQPVSPSPHADHTSEAPHRHSAQQREAIVKALALDPTRMRLARAKDNDSWKDIWQTFLGMPTAKKKILMFVALFVAVIVGFTPFLLLFFLYYVTQPAKIRNHLHTVVTYFA